MHTSTGRITDKEIGAGPSLDRHTHRQTGPPAITSPQDILTNLTADRIEEEGTALMPHTICSFPLNFTRSV